MTAEPTAHELEELGHDELLARLQAALAEEGAAGLLDTDASADGEHNSKILITTTLLYRMGFGAAVLLFPIHMFGADPKPEAWPVGVAVASHFLSEMATRPRTKRTTMGQLRGP